MLDKVLVSIVWVMGLVNTLLSEYIVSKNPHTLCSIRDDLGSSLVLTSIVLVIVLPVLLGPVLVGLLHGVLYAVEHVLDVSRPEPRPGEDTSQEVRRPKKEGYEDKNKKHCRQCILGLK